MTAKPTVVPMLFSAPMARALLREIEAPGAGKTQTRRLAWARAMVRDKPCVGWRVDEACGAVWKPTPWKKLYDRWQAGERDVVIWVRETWHPTQWNADHDPRFGRPDGAVAFAADFHGNPALKWKPSIHMPRWASRLTLVVSDVRMERLQDISEADAEAEGCTWDSADGLPVWYVSGARLPHHKTARECFACLWDSINASRAPWSSNPEVVAITFSPRLVNVDQHIREAGRG